MPSEAFIELAGRLADETRKIVCRHFRSEIAVDQKPDMTPVTKVDRAAETSAASSSRCSAKTVPTGSIPDQQFFKFPLPNSSGMFNKRHSQPCPACRLLGVERAKSAW